MRDIYVSVFSLLQEYDDAERKVRARLDCSFLM